MKSNSLPLLCFKIYLILVLIVIFSVFIRLPNFFSPLLELHDFRQTQTASNVWLYQKFGFKLFEYHVPMFGGMYWMNEFPTYQMVVFLFSKIFGFHDWVGRLVSLISIINSIILLFYIYLKLLGNKIQSLYGVLIYTLTPLNIFFYRTYIPDPLILSISLGTLFLTFRLNKKFSYKILYSIYFLILLCLLSKITITFSLIFPILYLIYRSINKHKDKIKIYKISIGFILLSIILYFFWYQHTQFLNSKSFTLSDGTLINWYLGTKFLSLDFYRVIFSRIIGEISILGILLSLLGLLYLKSLKNENTKMPIYPVISLLIAIGIIKFNNIFTGKTISKIIILLFFTYYYFNSFDKMKSIYAPYTEYSHNILSIADTIKSCTSPNYKIISAWPNADPNHPTIFYYSKRIGYNLDLIKISKLNEILNSDNEIKYLVLYPVDRNSKQ
ncbi:glycosyltransferase family 39 protein, partial [Candidatus Gottesmanbacteria bacterium]|nr:glycosyltransferase family 39 protein [Candidatus Gottesmanbacteria bacterium]